MLLAAGVARAAPAIDPGAALFQAHCYACHSIDPAETSLPGPNLFRVLGRKAASRPAFDYSPALRAAGTAGLVWTAGQVDRMIADPAAFLPGTEMTFPGLDSAADRAAIIGFLRRSAGPRG